MQLWEELYNLVLIITRNWERMKHFKIWYILYVQKISICDKTARKYFGKKKRYAFYDKHLIKKDSSCGKT